MKGKDIPVPIYKISETPITERMQAVWKEGLRLFEQREFEAAKVHFSKVASEFIELSAVCEVYIQESIDFLNTPPSAEWKGSVTMDHK